MFSWRSTVLRYQSISWLLVVAIIALTLLPTHLHLGHTDSHPSASHKHTTSLHIAIDNIADDHHSDATVLSVTPDVLVKKVNDNPLLAAAILLVTLLLLAVTSRPLKYATNANRHRLSTFYSLTPPLRAPPQS